VNKLGPVALEVGDKFKLFSAASFSGAFNSISLPLLASGLAWTNKLLLDGSIEVVASPGPKIEAVSVIGTKLVYAISSGTPGGSYVVLTTTNIALPLTNWSVATNDTFDWLGNSNFTNALNSSTPSSFFKLFVP
jgi:hypothetical protein